MRVSIRLSDTIHHDFKGIERRCMAFVLHQTAQKAHKTQIERNAPGSFVSYYATLSG